MGDINFYNADVKFLLRQKRKLQAFIRHQVIQACYQPLSNLSFVFCSDEYLLEINKKFLRHDYYTDIITFPLSGPGQPLEGEIYISIDRVKENASKFAKGNEELLRVMFHGVLHLLGYKDKTRDQKLTMQKMEDKWLKTFKTFKIYANS